jgi:hypothetical protein
LVKAVGEDVHDPRGDDDGAAKHLKDMSIVETQAEGVLRFTVTFSANLQK